MLDTLRRIVQEVNNAADIRSALDLMAKRVRDAMGTEVCSIYLRDEDDQRYVLMASEGLKQEAVGRVSLGLSEGAGGAGGPARGTGQPGRRLYPPQIPLPGGNRRRSFPCLSWRAGDASRQGAGNHGRPAA